jgi:hypothetical protein
MKYVLLAILVWFQLMAYNAVHELRSIATDLHAGVGCMVKAQASADSLNNEQRAFITAWETYRDTASGYVKEPEKKSLRKGKK